MQTKKTISRNQKIILWLFGILGFAPVCATVFTILCVWLWGVWHDHGNPDVDMGVAGSYLWIFLCLPAGLGLGIAIWGVLCHGLAKQWRRSALALVVAGVFAGGVVTYLLTLFAFDLQRQYEQKNWRSIAEKKAAQGDSEGNFILGVNSASTPEAIKYLTLAAEQGHYLAALELGDLYCSESDFKHSAQPNPCRDPLQGIAWYRQIASVDNPNSDRVKYRLGSAYSNEHDELCDYEKAVFWYSQSASSEAQYQLGRIYMEGKLGEPNYLKAEQFFQKSIAAGGYDAYFQLGQIAEKGLLGDPNPALAKQYYQTGSIVSDSCAQALQSLTENERE